mmetsp:Transcript_21399/g.49385  ORF Transcript_21399/g.49385 Transcript_21399/m.49385 type:complete len:102 (-) Transcript_21399:95-400(-)
MHFDTQLLSSIGAHVEVSLSMSYFGESKTAAEEEENNDGYNAKRSTKSFETNRCNAMIEKTRIESMTRMAICSGKTCLLCFSCCRQLWARFGGSGSMASCG